MLNIIYYNNFCCQLNLFKWNVQYMGIYIDWQFVSFIYSDIWSCVIFLLHYSCTVTVLFLFEFSKVVLHIYILWKIYKIYNVTSFSWCILVHAILLTMIYKVVAQNCTLHYMYYNYEISLNKTSIRPRTLKIWNWHANISSIWLMWAFCK